MRKSKVAPFLLPLLFAFLTIATFIAWYIYPASYDITYEDEQ